VDNNYLDLGMNKSGFVHTLPSGRFNGDPCVPLNTFPKLVYLSAGHSWSKAFEKVWF
jgi:hypothetical protein